MVEYKKIRNEFLVISSDQELDLENVIEVTFNNISDTDVVINNAYPLSRLQQIINGVTNFENKLVIKNNLNEIDVTTYRIRFVNPAAVNKRLLVIAKYIVN
jgi:hypothetical protein